MTSQNNDSYVFKYESWAKRDLPCENDSGVGVKHDEGKPPLGLLPRYALEEVALVLAHGAEKYGKDNWRNGLDWSRLVDASLRHIYAFNDGEDLDPESGRSHIAHALCMLLFLLESTKDVELQRFDNRRGKPARPQSC